MNRFPAAVAPLLLLILCAQVPYEYFEISEITPPNIPNRAAIQHTASIPDSLTLDNQTQVAGNLTLSEPFAPPVGVYKRRNVFSTIVYRDDAFFIEPSLDSCVQVQFKPEPADTLPLRRSALVYLEIGDQPVDLPADSPEMRITSLETQAVASNASTEISVLRCRDQNYLISAKPAGLYRIEYDTASPADAATPVEASFFESDPVPVSTYLDPDIVTHINDIIQHSPELQSIKGSHAQLADLIRFFQSFTSDYLEQDEQQPTTGESLLTSILTQKKGLCRHRAILFTLVAQAWGYHARIAANEVHAFVEIQHKGRWYPVELGGSASSLTIEPTNRALSTTVLGNFSFDQQHTYQQDPNSKWFAHPQTAPNDSEIGTIMDIPESAFQMQQTGTTLFFTPKKRFPSQILRDEIISIAGILRTDQDSPAADADITLEIINIYKKRLTRVHAHTDKKGYFELSFKLPPDWPIGETNIIWKIRE